MTSDTVTREFTDTRTKAHTQREREREGGEEELKSACYATIRKIVM